MTMTKLSTSSKSRSWNLRSHLMAFLLGASLSYAVLSKYPKENCLEMEKALDYQQKIIGTEDENPLESIQDGMGAIAPQPKENDCSCPKEETKEKSFLELGRKTSTDKVEALDYLPGCLQAGECLRANCTREECRPWGHFYHTLYQQRIGRYSLDTVEPFQFLEIGFYNGNGYDTYRSFFSSAAELHSMEISCMPEGPREEGKWPWGNFAKENKNYQKYLDEDRLHCGDASDFKFLNHIWKNKMHRLDSPPLKIVVDDGSHLSWHMAQSVFFWFPRIEPGGLMVVEDIQPIDEANLFRTQFLPQIMSDLHFCGDPEQPPDNPCFPTLQPLLQSIHCEMHICIFERNQKQANPDLPLEDSIMPDHTFNASGCPSIGKSWGVDLPHSYRSDIDKALEQS